MIENLEADLSPTPAYPVTLKLLEAWQACEEIGGERSLDSTPENS